MKSISIKDYNKLPFNDPLRREVGELFIMKYSEDDDLPEVEVGSVVGLMEVKRLTERGHESVLKMVRIIK
jgi:hypothetical protein